MEEMGFLGPFLIQLGALVQWAGLETPKLVAVHQRVNECYCQEPIVDVLGQGAGS